MLLYSGNGKTNEHDFAALKPSKHHMHVQYYITLDNRKNFQFKKRGIGIESDKYANNLEIKKVWKQVKDGA